MTKFLDGLAFIINHSVMIFVFVCFLPLMPILLPIIWAENRVKAKK